MSDRRVTRDLAGAHRPAWAGGQVPALHGHAAEETTAPRGPDGPEQRHMDVPAKRRKDTRSKTRTRQVATKDLVIILPKQAVALLREIRPSEPDQLVFVGPRGAPVQNWDRSDQERSQSDRHQGLGSSCIEANGGDDCSEPWRRAPRDPGLVRSSNISGGQLVAGTRRPAIRQRWRSSAESSRPCQPRARRAQQNKPLKAESNPRLGK